MQVALINMPFIRVGHANSALCLLKALLAEIDVQSKIFYLNIDFYNMFESAVIAELVNRNPYDGDWLASRSAFGEHDNSILYFDLCHYKPDMRLALLTMRNIFENFIQRVLEDPIWAQYKVFAFSTNLGQTVASIAFARLLKERYPQSIICLGGYGVFREIGVEVIKKTPWLDCIFWGNSDKTFPTAMQRLKQGQDIEQALHGMKCVAFRKNNRIEYTFGNNEIDHNQICIPQFDDYLQKDIKSDAPVERWCGIEFSRGCYYGESVVCTFCSEPGLKMKTIPRTPENALKYLEDLQKTYPEIEHYTIGDALLPQGYIDDVFSVWADKVKPHVNYFTELKPYASPKQLRILKSAGVTTIQPGIESFHPEILKLTKKGHKVHHGFSFLNFCKFYGIKATWNYLILAPLENRGWYDEQIDLVKKVSHLPPPITSGKIVITKFTPYIDDPEKYGLKNLKPDPLYTCIYPPSFDMNELCWNYETDIFPHDKTIELLAAIKAWSDCVKELFFIDSHTIVDSRSGVIHHITISETERQLLRFCLYPKSLASIQRAMSQSVLDINRLSQLGLVYSSDNRVVTLVDVPPDYDEQEFEEEKNLVQLRIHKMASH